MRTAAWREVIQRAGPPGYWRSRGLHGQRDRIGEEPALSSSRNGIDTAATFARVAIGLRGVLSLAKVPSRWPGRREAERSDVEVS